MGMSLWGYTGELVSIPMTVSAHSLNLGIFCPENWYLLPVMWTEPSSLTTNSVSLNPHPLTLNHCSLFLMDSDPFIYSLLNTTARFFSLSIQWY